MGGEVRAEQEVILPDGLEAHLGGGRRVAGESRYIIFR